MPEQKSSGEVIEVPVYWLWIVLGAVLLFLIGLWLYRYYDRSNEPAPDTLPNPTVASPTTQRSAVLNNLPANTGVAPTIQERQAMVNQLKSKAPVTSVENQSRANLLNNLP